MNWIERLPTLFKTAFRGSTATVLAHPTVLLDGFATGTLDCLHDITANASSETRMTASIDNPQDLNTGGRVPMHIEPIARMLVVHDGDLRRMRLNLAPVVG
jgi:hypothetical protein